MSTYVIGDLQGCFQELKNLLKKIDFDTQRDALWLVGDLVNRGPNSLATLRFLHQLNPAPMITLGNHDLYLLKAFYTQTPLSEKSTLQEVLDAPDAKILCDWLRQQKMLHVDQDHKAIMSHAGISPEWDFQTAVQCAEEVEHVLQSDQYITFLENLYGNEPAQWDPLLTGWDRLRYSVNALTRMRFCSPQGQLLFEDAGPPSEEKTKQGLIPWFRSLPDSFSEYTIVFGHWAALRGQCDVENIHATDTGCAWGESLTALRLEDQQRFSVPNE